MKVLKFVPIKENTTIQERETKAKANHQKKKPKLSLSDSVFVSADRSCGRWMGWL